MADTQKELMIEFDIEKCTQCHGCEIACKTWRNLDYGIQYRRVLNIWQGEYPRVKNVSLSIACMHCAEPACMSACPEGAITKKVKDGLVVVDKTLCSGCGICAEVCPYNHYARKNIGYLYAIQQGADIIYDTDDDNLPYDDWDIIDFSCDNFLSLDSKFVNVYKYFTNSYFLIFLF